jgi:hypothetical protein
VLCLLGHPSYGNHTVTFCGWGPPDRDWVMVHDCWGGTQREVVLNCNYGSPVGVVAVRPLPMVQPPPDLALAGVVRPVPDGRPGAFAPEVAIANSGGSDAAARVFFRVQRPGGGLDESFPGSAAFPPVGWQRSCQSAESRWVQGVSDSLGLSGWAECRPGAADARGEDWLVTPTMRVGPADTVRFSLSAAGTERESIDVWALSGDPASADRGLRIGTFGCSGPEPVQCAAGFGPVGDTLASVGFRYLGGPGSAGLRLDDVTLAAVHYSESVDVAVPAGAEAGALFRPWDVPLGHYVAACSVWCSRDEQPLNDTALRGFVVRHIAEEPDEAQPARPLPVISVSPSIVRGTTRLDGWRGAARLVVFDALGRQVLSRDSDGPGPLDCSRLTGGVYLLRVATADGTAAPTRFTVLR